MSERKMTVNIITPLKQYQFENVLAFFAPGKKGKFEVLLNHAPLISELEVGVIKIKDEPNEQKLSISSGYCEIKENEIIVLAEAAEKVEEIDLERAEYAKKRAQERVTKKDSQVDIERAKFAIKRALNRINLKNSN